MTNTEVCFIFVLLYFLTSHNNNGWHQGLQKHLNTLSIYVTCKTNNDFWPPPEAPQNCWENRTVLEYSLGIAEFTEGYLEALHTHRIKKVIRISCYISWSSPNRCALMDTLQEPAKSSKIQNRLDKRPCNTAYKQTVLLLFSH